MVENKYTETVGRRKSASARVRIVSAKSTSVMVNKKAANDYFPLAIMHNMVLSPIQTVGGAYAVTAIVKGGGLKSQAEAIRHAIARALVERDAAVRKDLKVKGYLKRDPRAKERKKFGLKGARRAPQWSKR